MSRARGFVNVVRAKMKCRQGLKQEDHDLWVGIGNQTSERPLRDIMTIECFGQV